MVNKSRCRARNRYLRATSAAVLGAVLACVPNPNGTLSYASPLRTSPSSTSDPAVLAPVLALPLSEDLGADTVPAAVTGPAVRPVTLPDAALAAYQRAAQVIDAADPGCHLDWTLVAGVGAVESAHGRRTRPGQPLLGPLQDGTHGTTRIADTDHGSIDGSRRWDRAVGPLQFLPSTWRLVRVDADGDGRRDPQDLDDAALGAAVYLCGAGDDLATEEGRSAAVYRFEHSRHYVTLVLATAAAYADQAATAARTVTARPAVLPVVPPAPAPARPAHPPAPAPPAHHHPAHLPTPQPSQTPSPSSTTPAPHPSDGMVDPNPPVLPAPNDPTPTCPPPVVPVDPVDPVVPVAPALPPDPTLTPANDPLCVPPPAPSSAPAPGSVDPAAGSAPQTP